MPSGGRALPAQICVKRAVGQISAALHVIDAGAERAVAVDPERQPLDESERVHGVEMAQHQNAGRVLAPGRARHQMVAAAVAARDALDRDGQVAIAVRDHVGELVDLRRNFGRRFDLDPAADAVEDGCRIEGIGCRASMLIALQEISAMSCARSLGYVNPLLRKSAAISGLVGAFACRDLLDQLDDAAAKL